MERRRTRATGIVDSRVVSAMSVFVLVVMAGLWRLGSDGDPLVLDDARAAAAVTRPAEVPTPAARGDDRDRVAAQPRPIAEPGHVVATDENGLPSMAVKGTVIDVDGHPVAGAMLSIALANDGGDDAGADGVRRVQCLAFSDAAGAFAFAAVPGCEAARFRTQHPGHRTDERALPIASSCGVVVTLFPEPPPTSVSGTVFGPDGAPFAGANVRMGEIVVASRTDGTFVLVPPSRLPRGTSLFVLANGCVPVALADPRPADGGVAPPLTVSLQRAIPITGRIVDAAGSPLPGWTVQLGDSTPLVPGCGADASVEGRLGDPRTVTDAVGQFAIHGVFARSYSIEAWSERGDRGLRAVASPADGFVTLVAVEREATTLRGIVVDGDGRAVAGALVGEERPGCLATGAPAMRFDLRATTRADGTFELPLRGAALHVVVDAATIVPRRIALPADAIGAANTTAPFRIQVARRRDLRIDGSDHGALTFVPLDGDDFPLPASQTSPGTFALPTTTRTLVVQHHGVVTGTLPWPDGNHPFVLRLQPPSR